MERYKDVRIDNTLEFCLPERWKFIREAEDDGAKSYSVSIDEYTDNSGKEWQTFTATVVEVNNDPSKSGQFFTKAEDLAQSLAEFSSSLETYRFPSNIPCVESINLMESEPIPGLKLNTLSLTVFVCDSGSHGYLVGVFIPIISADLFIEYYDRLIEVISMMKINGKPVGLKNASAADFCKRRGIDLPETAQTPTEKTVDPLAEYQKLSDTIHHKKQGGKDVFAVNKEWTFTLPSGLNYSIDSNYKDDGIGSYESQKPMVIKDYDCFNFALDRHLHFLGEYYSVTDCRYDNQFLSDNDNGAAEQSLDFGNGLSFTFKYGDDSIKSRQIKVKDTNALYVDIAIINDWLMGLNIQMRVRGDNIAPYNISTTLKNVPADKVRKIVDKIEELASSVKLLKATPAKVKSKKEPAKKEAKPQEDFIVEDGVLVKYISKKKQVVIPDGVTAIANSVFSGRADITSVIVPEGVKSIGRRAFENCFALKTVSLPQSLEEIGGYAFVDCHELKSIYLSDHITVIPDSCFSECYALNNVTLPSKLTSIDAFAFKNCRSFTNIVIPDGVTSIGFTAFASCDALKTIYIPETVTEMPDNFMNAGVFGGCKQLTIHGKKDSFAATYAAEHNIPFAEKTQPKAKENKKTLSAKEKNEKSLEWIGDFGLKNGELRMYKGSGDTVTIPKEIKSVLWNYKPFKNAKVKHMLVEHGATRLMGFVSENKDLESLDIPGTIKHLYRYSFNNCSNLKCITLHEGIKAIDLQVFDGCTALKEVLIPASVAEIINEQGNSFEWITFRVYRGSYAEKRLKELDNAVGCSKWSISVLDEEPPHDETTDLDHEDYDFEIEHGVLKRYLGIKEAVKVPDGVVRIASYAFARSSCKSIELPKSLRIIEPCAFRECQSLTEIDIPAGVGGLCGDGYSNPFYQCYNLKTVKLHEGLRCLSLEILEAIKAERLELPSSVRVVEPQPPWRKLDADKLLVYSGSEAQRALNRIGQPYTVRGGVQIEREHTIDEYSQADEFVIEKGALLRYDGFARTVTIPDGVKSIAEKAFYANPFIEKVILPNTIKRIGVSAFDECVMLREINLPDGLRNLSSSAFHRCISLEEIRIPSSVKATGEYIFYECKGLKKLILEEGIEKIGHCAFNGCTKLAHVEFPQSLREIKQAAFSGIGMTEVYVSDGVNFIGNYAFRSETLRDLHLPRDAKLDTYFQPEENTTLHVYRGSPAEAWAKENGAHFVYELTPAERETKRRREEAEARRKAEQEARRREEAERQRKLEEARREEERLRLEARKKYRDALNKDLDTQEQIVAENRGLFGESARRRRAAKARIKEINEQLEKIELAEFTAKNEAMLAELKSSIDSMRKSLNIT